MNRLRVRVELNRRKAGVPLDELVGVVEETRKFFHLLAEDVEIETSRGAWHASDFDPESLNFTAEYEGPASADQIRDFGAAFRGSTSLRQQTIAQFTHIADLIGEDELVGFGLYQSDQETEPSDWRCLSRRDALRFSSEIQLLAKAAGESAAALPAANGSAGGRRLFKDRREREVLSTDPAKRIREVESNLSNRLALLEEEIEAQSHKLQRLSNTPEAADERVRQLVVAMESFWNQAPKQLALPSAEAAPAAATSTSYTPARPKSLKYYQFLVLLVLVAAVTLAGLSSSKGKAQVARLSAALGFPRHAAQAPVARASLSAEARPEVDSLGNIRQIALPVPAHLRPAIESEALVYVTVAIDEDGAVTNAKLLFSEGDGSELLIETALSAARRFHFQPVQMGNKNVPSQTVLTFAFEPRT